MLLHLCNEHPLQEPDIVAITLLGAPVITVTGKLSILSLSLPLSRRLFPHCGRDPEHAVLILLIG